MHKILHSKNSFKRQVPLDPRAQWKFSSQKGMKINFLAKAGLEPWTAEIPQ